MLADEYFEDNDDIIVGDNKTDINDIVFGIIENSNIRRVC